MYIVNWDAGNIDKNWELHQVSAGEREQVFFQRPILIAPDPGHSQGEARYAAPGQTASGRRLTVVFTMRDTLIRVISVLKPSTRTISLRLPQALLEEIKALANERDVPYQSLLKIFLAERVARERHRTSLERSS